MEIMRFVKNQVKDKTLLFYLCVFFTMGDTVVLIMDATFSNQTPPWGEDLVWRVLLIGPLMLIVYIWLYYAPIVCKDLWRLKNAFLDKIYPELYISFRRRLNQSLFLKGSIKEKVFKWTYTVLWLVFYLEFLFFVADYLFIKNRLLTWESAVLYVCLTSIAITLNFSSYYICIMFVHFLMCLYKAQRENGLEHVAELPSVTHGFQVLLHTANTIYLYFLVDSFLSTIAFFALWKLTPKEGLTGERYWMYVRLDFLYMTIFLIVCGLGTWIFIVLVSRAYLRRLHYEWVYCSSIALRKTYRTTSGAPKEQAVIDKERLYQDKISITGWDLLISLTALAANLFTAWSIFADII